MSRPFRTPAQIMGIRALADSGLALNVHTKELSKEEKAVVFDYQLKAGWLLFAENPIQEADIPDQPAEVEAKSQSRRIRACLFLLWKQRGEQGDFEQFYREQTEKIINHIKSKLDQ